MICVRGRISSLTKTDIWIFGERICGFLQVQYASMKSYEFLPLELPTKRWQFTPKAAGSPQSYRVLQRPTCPPCPSSTWDHLGPSASARSSTWMLDAGDPRALWFCPKFWWISLLHSFILLDGMLPATHMYSFLVQTVRHQGIFINKKCGPVWISINMHNLWSETREQRHRFAQEELWPCQVERNKMHHDAPSLPNPGSRNTWLGFRRQHLFVRLWDFAQFTFWDDLLK